MVPLLLSLLQVRGVSELCVPGQPFQTHDTYCVCSYGDSTVRPRTRVVEDSASPQWNEVRVQLHQQQHMALRARTAACSSF